MMELDQFNEGILWPVVPHYWTLLHPLSSGIQSQTPWSQKHCPLMSISTIRQCPLKHRRTCTVWAQYNVHLSLPPAAVGVGVCRHCNPAHQALLPRKSQVTEWVTFLPFLHLPLKCLQLLTMQEDHLSTTSETQKFENNCDNVGFSTLNCPCVQLLITQTPVIFATGVGKDNLETFANILYTS